MSDALEATRTDAQIDLQSWKVEAVNLPEHAVNAIHTDAGGRAAGFDGALVAGVTVYAYLTHPAAAAWGLDWITSGTADVRFRAPVLDGDRIALRPRPDDVGTLIEALVEGDVRATCLVGLAASTLNHEPDSTPAPSGSDNHERLEAMPFKLEGRWDRYGERAGDDLSIYADHGLVHPAVWPALANQMVHQQLVIGAWVHTRSRIRHHSTAAVGDHVTATGVVLERFATRSGEKAILDVQIRSDRGLVASIGHEALVALHR